MNKFNQPTPDHVPHLAMRSREAAEALGISPRTLHTWTRDLGVPHFKLKGTVLYPIRELQDWLTAQAKATGGA